MFNKKIISTIILYCCFFQNISHCLFIQKLEQNMHNKDLDKKLGKHIFSFVEKWNGNLIHRWYYTTELSRILLVGEPKIFESIKWYPIIDVFSEIGPLFDNRFNDFIKQVKQYSEQELEEAIQDALLLSQYSTKGYKPNKLLDHLIATLKFTINQIEHNYRWDQQSCSDLKKSAIWLVSLIAIIALTNKSTTYNNQITNKTIILELINDAAILGSIPLSYKILQNSYKILTTDPSMDNQYLHKYEELLLFVQKLQLELSTNDCITIKLASGYVATINDDELSFQ